MPSSKWKHRLNVTGKRSGGRETKNGKFASEDNIDHAANFNDEDELLIARNKNQAVEKPRVSGNAEHRSLATSRFFGF